VIEEKKKEKEKMKMYGKGSQVEGAKDMMERG
jgi:hypothetical protein